MAGTSINGKTLDMNVKTGHRLGFRIKPVDIELVSSVLLLLPFFRLQLVSIMMLRNGGIWTTINSVYNVLQALISIIEILLYLSMGKVKPGKEHILYGFFVFVIMRLSASVINGSFTFFTSFSDFVIIGFILASYRIIKRDMKQYVNSIEFIAGSLSIIGAVTSIIMPLGFFPEEVNLIWGYGQAVHFLGSKNSLVFYYLTFLMIHIYKEAEVRNNYSNFDYVLFGLFIASTIRVNSINGTLCLLILLVYFVAVKFRLPIKKVINPRYLAFLSIIVGIVILSGNTPNFNVFRIIGRDAGFTGRTTLWYLAGKEIAKHPIIGNGINAVVFIGEKPWAHVHSTYVDIVFKYGIPTLVVFVLICIEAFRITAKITDERKRMLLAMVLFIFYLHNMADAPNFFCMIIPMCIAENDAMEDPIDISDKGEHNADRKIPGNRGEIPFI